MKTALMVMVIACVAQVDPAEALRKLREAEAAAPQTSADDPAELKRQVAKLKKELADAQQRIRQLESAVMASRQQRLTDAAPARPPAQPEPQKPAGPQLLAKWEYTHQVGFITAGSNQVTYIDFANGQVFQHTGTALDPNAVMVRGTFLNTGPKPARFTFDVDVIPGSGLRSGDEPAPRGGSARIQTGILKPRELGSWEARIGVVNARFIKRSVVKNIRVDVVDE